MALHHKIKPRHHVAIWMAAVLLFVGSIVAYNTATIGVLRAEGGPSASTKKFFGFNDDNGQGQQWVQPAACQRNDLQTQMQSLQAQMQQVQQQVQALNGQYQNGQPTTDQQAQMQQLQSQLTSLTSQMQALSPQMQQGPSDDCKKAIVAQVVSQMQAQQTKMFNDNKLTGTLDKVDAVVTKIEADLSGLQTAGVSADDIATIKSDIASIKADNLILRNFFAQMKAQMANFIAQGQADPLKIFSQMQSGNGPMDSKSSDTAANAADGMVSSFTSLVSILDNITGS